jgi:hypothetical protein
MDASKLRELRDFVEACKKNPSLLADPNLSFFRDYLQRSISHPPSSLYLSIRPHRPSFFLIVGAPVFLQFGCQNSRRRPLFRKSQGNITHPSSPLSTPRKYLLGSFFFLREREGGK